MREGTDLAKLQRFIEQIGSSAEGPGRVYLVGGATALLLGVREQTIYDFYGQFLAKILRGHATDLSMQRPWSVPGGSIRPECRSFLKRSSPISSGTRQSTLPISGRGW
jgi:hypothetical protein